MAKRLRNCPENEISAILDSSSGSEEKQEKSNVRNKTARKVKRVRRSSRLSRQSSDATDTDDKLTCKAVSSVENPSKCRKRMSLLKIKLRRSTEQSMYKIDADVRNQRFSDKEVMTKRKSVETGTDENEPSTELVDIDKNTPRKTNRVRKIPSRYVDYQCLDFPTQNTPTLKSGKVLNGSKSKLHSAQAILIDNEKVHKEQVLHTDRSDDDRVHTVYGLRPTRLRCQLNRREQSPKNKSIGSKTRKGRKKIDQKLSSSNEHRSPEHFNRSIAIKSPSKACSYRTSESLSEEETTPVLNKENEPIVTRKKYFPDKLDIKKHSLNEITITEVKTDLPATPRRKSYMRKDTIEIIKNPVASKSFASPKLSGVTPSMKKRSTLLIKPLTPLQQARSKLHVSVVPKSLPCREEEFNDIFSFLERRLVDGSGGCIYISGVPGTGKTATVNEAIRCLRKLEGKKELPSFNYVEINGMKMSEPRQTYVQILRQLSGKLATWESAYNILDKQFSNSDSKKPMTLILVDELDLLCTKRQDVVYNLFDWPTRRSARLVIITIANTMDLPERVLMGRVTSRLGLTRVTFQPYTHQQLQEIILTRLKHIDAFRGEAIELVARKVAAVSGDARRALDICRRATEIAESKRNATVSMIDLNDAFMEMVAAPKVQAIKHCSRMEQIFLQSVCAEIARTGVEEAIFKNIYKQFDSICSFSGIQVPTVTEALNICARLGASRLLICEHSRTDISQRILLNVSPDDVHYALHNVDND